jgi:hypothetical protein
MVEPDIRMTSRWLGLWLMLSVAPAMPAAEPQWLTDARAREAKLGEPREIRSADGWFSARLPVAVTGKIEKEQGSYTVEFKLDPDTTASCEVYPDPRDPAALLRGLGPATFTAIEKTRGKVEVKGVEAVDAGEFGATPYLAVGWLYRVNDGKQALVGALRQYAALKQEHGIYCLLDQVGYVRTFESVVRALLESLEFHDKTPPPKPFYSELSVGSLKGLKVGYSLLTLERDADGDVKAVEHTAILIPVTPDTLSSLDTFTLEWTHADGAMINSARVVSVNDTLDADLKLGPAKGHWQVEGEFKSKKLDATIDSANPPGSWLSQARQRRAMLAADPAAPREVVAQVWLSADPTHFVESRMTFLDRAPGGGQAHFRDSVAGIVADVTADATTGQILKATIPIGAETIMLERVDAHGSY